MGILASDLLIKSALETAIAHLRANNWLLDDVYGELAGDRLAGAEYGYKEAQAAKNWFINNNIRVVFPFRQDTPTFPCITIVNTSTVENTEHATLGDEGYEDDDFDPKANALLPQLIYRPFTPAKYNRDTGYVEFPHGTDNEYVVPGQFLVSARSGKAYQIYKTLDINAFEIKPGVADDFTGAYIVPPTSLWNAKKERIRINENFTIGCHAQSDASQATWLRMLVMYIVMRYKEAYLESRGFELSTFSMSEIDLNPNFNNTDKIFSCYLSLSGSIETSFIKYVAPKLQSVTAGIRIADGPKTPEAYLKQVQKQGWMMENDQPAFGPSNVGGIDENGDGFTVQQGDDQIDGGEDDV